MPTISKVRFYSSDGIHYQVTYDGMSLRYKLNFFFWLLLFFPVAISIMFLPSSQRYYCRIEKSFNDGEFIFVQGDIYLKSYLSFEFAKRNLLLL